MIALTVNGRPYRLDIEPETPLLWVIRDEIGLTGTKFGCGIAQCGACTVHVNGDAVRSCSLAVGDADGAKITTIEGLSADGSHPVQRAWTVEDVPQCGYCQSGQIMAAVALLQKAWAEIDVPQCGYCQAGQIMSAAALLKRKPKPSETEIDEAMNGNICRCGTYTRIRAAIKQAALQPGGTR